MIDYEKLKQVIELVGKIDYGIKYLVDKSLAGNPTERFYLTHYGEEERFDSIDDLIEKLQELTQPNPKYKVGQEVWVLSIGNEIFGGIVHDWFDDSQYVIKLENGRMVYFSKDRIYPSFQALIEAQISYWQSMLSPRFEGEIKGFDCSESIRRHHELEDDDHSVETHEKVCIHEKDKGYSLDAFDLADLSPHKRCIKCGVFYK